MRYDVMRCGLKVDIGRIRENIRELSALAPGRKILCTVKANAYGHGMELVAGGIEDLADMFAVATVGEGVALRKLIKGSVPILILGPVSPADNEYTLRYSLTQTIFDLRRAKALSDRAAAFFALKRKDLPEAFHDHRAHIHIAVDTGMSRIGLRPDEEGVEIVREIMALPHIAVDGCFTHFAVADEADPAPTLEAYERFRHFKSLCEKEGIGIPIWHAANTAAVIAGIGTDFEMDMVRLGIGIYGLYPSEAVDRSRVRLRPAALWYAYLSYVKDIPAGTSVSYGYTYTAPRDMRIGTVSCGYADGMPRVRSNIGQVIIEGVRCPIIGTICMDQFMVDLSRVPQAEAGSPVILMGDDITADEIAREAHTISYEILCAIASRVPRIP